MNNRKVIDRRVELGLQELAGGVVAPDLSREIAARYARGEVVREPRERRPTSYRGLAAAAVVLLGVAMVFAIAVGDRPAQDPEISLAPLEMLQVFYQQDGAELLEQERLRLLTWLARDGHWSAVVERPERIHWFNNTPAALGGPFSARIRWYPRLVRGGRSSAENRPGVRVVPLFDPAMEVPLRDGEAEREGLVELLPIDASAWRCDAAMIDADRVVRRLDESGRPVLEYELLPEHKEAYRSWSESLIQRMSAITVDGVVWSTPVFMAAITGPAQVTSLPEDLLDGLIERLKTAAPAKVLAPEPAGVPIQDLVDADQRAKAIVAAQSGALTFGQLAEWMEGVSEPAAVPAGLRALDGTEVAIHGFVLPTWARGGRAAELIPSIWGFGFAKVPDPAIAVQVEAEAPITDLAGRFCRVSGRLRLVWSGGPPRRPLRIEVGRVTAID